MSSHRSWPSMWTSCPLLPLFWPSEMCGAGLWAGLMLSGHLHYVCSEWGKKIKTTRTKWRKSGRKKSKYWSLYSNTDWGFSNTMAGGRHVNKCPYLRDTPIGRDGTATAGGRGREKGPKLEEGPAPWLGLSHRMKKPLKIMERTQNTWFLTLH